MNRLTLALSFVAAELALASHPTPFPVFLRAGFSSVLEFEEAPSRVVLGDSASFQVERLDQSLIVKPLSSSASTNLFVYFKSDSPRLFVLTASDDAEPTYFRKFEKLDLSPRRQNPTLTPQSLAKLKTRITKASLDPKNDYLTVDAVLKADGGITLEPEWGRIRLVSNDRTMIAPLKLWSERKVIQRGTGVRTRLIFARPDVRGSKLVLKVPLKGGASALQIPIEVMSR
jgi:hypothetical protein